MSENREKDQQLVVAFFQQLNGWCGIRNLIESIPLEKEIVLTLIHEMVQQGILIKENDGHTKKAWYHLSELSIQAK